MSKTNPFALNRLQAIYCYFCPAKGPKRQASVTIIAGTPVCQEHLQRIRQMEYDGGVRVVRRKVS